MLTKAMTLELASLNILVNAMAPGGILTPGSASIRKTVTDTTGITSDQIIEAFLNHVPVGRTGAADDIAKVVLFLSSGASDYMCGEIVVVEMVDAYWPSDLV